MTTKFNCPNCDQSIEAPNEMIGSSVQCPTCEQTFVMPAVTAMAAATPPPLPPSITSTATGTAKQSFFAKHRLLLACFGVWALTSIVNHFSAAAIKQESLQALAEEHAKMETRISDAVAKERARAAQEREQDRAEAERKLAAALSQERERTTAAIRQQPARSTPSWQPKIEIKPSVTPQREEQCLACRATGKMTCLRCKGTGFEECTKCEADGYITSGFFSKTRSRCTECKGTKSVKCGFWLGCNGTGIRSCDKCHGLGKIKI